MQLDVASYRRVAERWASKDEDINPSMAAVLMLQMCGEIERLQKADYEFQEKLADGITNAFLERRWIPVSERLPEDYDMVMLTDGDWVTFGCWSEISECWDVREDAEANGPRPPERFTHWMPLPEPPA